MVAAYNPQVPPAPWCWPHSWHAALTGSSESDWVAVLSSQVSSSLRWQRQRGPPGALAVRESIICRAVSFCLNSALTSLLLLFFPPHISCTLNIPLVVVVAVKAIARRAYRLSRLGPRQPSPVRYGLTKHSISAISAIYDHCLSPSPPPPRAPSYLASRSSRLEIAFSTADGAMIQMQRSLSLPGPAHATPRTSLLSSSKFYDLYMLV